MDVLFPFGAQHTACGIQGPSQELNPGPGRESTGSSPLDHQGTPHALLYSNPPSPDDALAGRG